MLYNANQDRSTNQRQDMEQLRKELKKLEGGGKAKKVTVGDTDEYQVRITIADSRTSLNPPPPQRLHRQDFVELTERARRSRPCSRRSQPPQGTDRGSPAEEPKSMSPIEVD